MSISVSSALATASVAANSPSTSAAQRIQQPTNQQTASSADTVRLTVAQQVYQLYNQGQAVSQIASNLSLTVSAVNGYLGNSGSTG
jgi:DNA-binding NarL/FixJ family response regulator